MTPEERAAAIWDQWDDRVSFVRVVAHAIRTATARERLACVRIVEAVRSPDRPDADPWNKALDAAAAAVRTRGDGQPPVKPA